MKKITIYCVLIFSQQFVNAQDWPVGTTWVYEQSDFSFPDPSNFRIFRIEADTVIQNQAVKILKEYYDYNTKDLNNSIKFFYTFYIKLENQKVSIWVRDSNKFLQIYDFNLQIGDFVSWYIGSSINIQSNYPLIVNYYITDVKKVNTSGPDKREYTYEVIDEKQDECFHYWENIIEDVGCTSYLFQSPCLIDPPPGGKLICFTNGIFSYPKGITCNLPTGLQEFVNTTLTIYPNPTNDLFSIRGLDLGDYSLDFYNQIGQRFAVEKNKDKIDISAFPSGIYFLKLKNEKKNISLKISKI